MKTIKSGFIGQEVQYLSDGLQRNGYAADSTTTFTESMKQAVMKFQTDTRLVADGIVGYHTWEHILFDGRSVTAELTDEDFHLLGLLLDCEPAALKAVQKVETGGRGGFIAPGKPTILFEGHIFWQQLKKKGIDPNKHVAGNSNILYPKWEKGHYKGGIGEYDRLEQARKIDRDAADASASWGMFQIMGFNYAACGEASVASFVAAMHEGECRQMILFGRFIRQENMLLALQDKNWNTFAKLYNGPSYAQNQYDKKLAKAYTDCSSQLQPEKTS